MATPRVEKEVEMYIRNALKNLLEKTNITLKSDDQTKFLNQMYTLVNSRPTLAHPKKLQPELDNSFVELLVNLNFEKLYQKGKGLDSSIRENDEILDLKKKVVNDLNKLQEKGLDLKNNPVALNTMIKLLVMKHCPKNKLNPDAAKDATESLKLLKKECERLLNELGKKDPELAKRLNDLLKITFNEMDKKITEQKDFQKEMEMLFKTVNTLSNMPKEKSFDDLPPEQKVKIITQGSDDGKFAMVPRNNVDMPIGSVLIFDNTPAELEAKADEKSLKDWPPKPTPDK